MGISLKNSFFKGFQHKYFLLLKVLHALQMYFLFYQNVLSNEIWVCWFFDSSIVWLRTVFSNAFKYSFDKSTTWRLMQLKLMSTSPHTSLAILAKKIQPFLYWIIFNLAEIYINIENASRVIQIKRLTSQLESNGQNLSPTCDIKPFIFHLKQSKGSFD